MAIEGETKSAQVDYLHRTARVDIETPYGAIPHVRFHRETVTFIDGKISNKSDWRSVERSAVQAAGDSVTIKRRDGTELTVNGIEMDALISAFGDLWETQDIERRAAEKAEAEAKIAAPGPGAELTPSPDNQGPAGPE